MTATDVHSLTMHRARKAGLIGAGLALVGAIVFPLAYPTTTAYVVAALLVLFAGYLALLMTRPAARLEGTTLHTRNIVRSASSDLRTAERVDLQDTGAGTVLLRVRSAGARESFLQLMCVTDYMSSATPPEELLLLVAAAGDRPATAEVNAVLRKQAAHLQAGGTLPDSPLAAWASNWASTMGKAGAAGTVLDP